MRVDFAIGQPSAAQPADLVSPAPMGGGLIIGVVADPTSIVATFRGRAGECGVSNRVSQASEHSCVFRVARSTGDCQGLPPTAQTKEVEGARHAGGEDLIPAVPGEHDLYAAVRSRFSGRIPHVREDATGREIAPVIEAKQGVQVEPRQVVKGHQWCLKVVGKDLLQSDFLGARQTRPDRDENRGDTRDVFHEGGHDSRIKTPGREHGSPVNGFDRVTNLRAQGVFHGEAHVRPSVADTEADGCPSVGCVRLDPTDSGNEAAFALCR